NYGMPVIATRIDGFTEHVTDGVDGFLFEVNDVDSLTEVLMKTVSLSQQEYAAVCENLKKTIAQKYSSESILAEYKRFFETI
ncbi:MAG: glycosyltransferase, partial [Bacteroidaceae bacterium]|nr:glycosyltransferase [Bacteroidaceae bacterium]